MIKDIKQTQKKSIAELERELEEMKMKIFCKKNHIPDFIHGEKYLVPFPSRRGK